MFKKMVEIKWEEVRKKLVSLGVQVVTDVKPDSTVSGYLDGHRFSLCWLEGTSTCILKIEKLLNLNSPIEDPFVKTISELLLGSNPFIIYKNKNQEGFEIIEWRKEEFQEERIGVLKAMKDVNGLKELNQ